MFKRERALCNFACGRYYLVEYEHYGVILSARGLLENYFGGNIVLLAENGIYHIKDKNIVHMQPIKMPSLDKFNERYQNLLKELEKEL